MLFALNINIKRLSTAAVAAAFFAVQIPVLALAGGTAYAEEAATGTSNVAGEQQPVEESTTETEQQPATETTPVTDNANQAAGATQPVTLTQGNGLANRSVNGAQNSLENSGQEKEKKKDEVTPLIAEIVVPPDTASVTLCHATHSAKNPFVEITVDASGAFNGHYGTGNGNHQDAEDIIPSFVYQGNTYSQNMTGNGPAILAAHCTGEEGEEPDSENITICHATGSTTNPFQKIENISAAGVFNGHLGNDHQNGEDIIPPFTYQGQEYSQNWNAAGQAIYDNGCVVEEEEPNPVNVTLCHATGSATNPYVKITVSAAGAFNGHLGNDHQNGEDIIPPFEYQGQTYSQNWTSAGQAIFANNCEVGGRGGNPLILNGGGGGGSVITTITTPAPQVKLISANVTPGQLANTGNSMWGSIFAAIAIMAVTASLALPVRKFQN